MRSLERKAILSPIHVGIPMFLGPQMRSSRSLIYILLFSLEMLLCNYFPFFSFFAEDVVKDIRVSCNSDDMTVTFYTTEVEFNGLVYPKGLSKNSSCMTEYIKHQSAVTYVIPLR